MKQDLEQLIAAVCKKLFSIDVDIVLTRPDEQFGDYATSIALQLSKKIGKNPREIAESIKNELHYESVTSVDIAGPGFLNITLNDDALMLLARQPPEVLHTKKKVVIETNNPNPFKAMHIGHAFNAIVADGIANLIEAGGAQTVRVSYHGDVGLHVGKSMHALLNFIDGDVTKLQEIIPTERNSFMSRMYAEGSKAYKESEQAKAAINTFAQQSFTLEDSLYKEVYEICKAWSFSGIDQAMERIGNEPVVTRYLESQADAAGVEVVKSHPEVFTRSDGAYVFMGSQYGSFDNVFVSSGGRGLYGARDLGLMLLKNQDHHPDKSYIVTAEEQRDYFVGVIKAAELSMPELAGVTQNLPTGTVRLSTGKMSSRDGDVLEIDWLFDQISAAILENGGQASDDMIASALRYQFLKVRVGSDVVFDISESVNLHGNSGPYLQYAHARACSILKKSISLQEKTAIEALPSERSLLRKLGEYSEITTLSIKELAPHHLCNYLYELCQVFNRFYENNKVIGDEREQIRLILVQMYQTTLGDGLALLGITAPEKM